MLAHGWKPSLRSTCGCGFDLLFTATGRTTWFDVHVSPKASCAVRDPVDVDPKQGMRAESSSYEVVRLWAFLAPGAASSEDSGAV